MKAFLENKTFPFLPHLHIFGFLTDDNRQTTLRNQKHIEYFFVQVHDFNMWRNPKLDEVVKWRWHNKVFSSNLHKMLNWQLMTWPQSQSLTTSRYEMQLTRAWLSARAFNKPSTSLSLVLIFAFVAASADKQQESIRAPLSVLRRFSEPCLRLLGAISASS